MGHKPPGSDSPAVERAVTELIRSLGLDPAIEPELVRTPVRIADLYREILGGLDPSSEPELASFPHEGGPDDLVIVRDIEFHSLCVHHFVPFFGRAHVAYMPDRDIIGVSGVPRVVEHYARRPQIQERMTRQIADHIERVVKPRGVGIVLEARHLCMEMRGIRRYGRVETRVVRGALAAREWVGWEFGGGAREGR